MSTSRRSRAGSAGEAGSELAHAELERRLDAEGRELLRLLLQDHVDLRAVRESRVAGAAAGSRRTRVETGHTRALATIFGEITVTRIAYREPGQPNLHPPDAVLNLPVEKHSHGLRQLGAIESSRGSFDGAVEAIERGTGKRLGLGHFVPVGRDRNRAAPASIHLAYALASPRKTRVPARRSDRR